MGLSGWRVAGPGERGSAVDYEHRTAAVYRAAGDLRDAVRSGDAAGVDRAIETLQALCPEETLRATRAVPPVERRS
jgi:hypothetical protein